VQGESALKAQYLTAEMKKYRPTGPTQPELMKIFHTTRHVFDPKYVVVVVVVVVVGCSGCSGHSVVVVVGCSGCSGHSVVVVVVVVASLQ